MKWLLIILLIPFSARCQTVHLKDGNIAYKGSEKINNITIGQLANAIKKAIAQTKNGKSSLKIDSSQNEIMVHATMKLNSEPAFIYTMKYQVNLKLKDKGYKYHIDSVVIYQKERGYETTIISSEKLVKSLDHTGPVATAAEKQLNEIDMRFQQLLDYLHNYSKE